MSSGSAEGSVNRNFRANPGDYLQQLCNRPVSLDCLQLLGGSVASSMKDMSVTNPPLATLYLQATARHLPAYIETSVSSSVPPPLAAAAAAGPVAQVLANNSISAETVQSGVQNAQLLNEISEALGYAAARCQPRSVIADTGILSVLQLALAGQQHNPRSSLISPGAALTPLHADFLQIALYAGQGLQAQEAIADTWPRPARGASAALVLRYYYLRGCVHLQSSNFEWAARCFWTCLVVPSDACSALMVAAWKKLIVLQALAQSDRKAMNAMKTPKTLPVCLSRYLNQAMSSGNDESDSSPEMPTSITAAPEDAAAASSSNASSLLHQEELAFADGAMKTDGSVVSDTSPASQAAVEASIRAYADLVKAFSKVDRAAFEKVLRQQGHYLSADQALVQMLQSEFARRQIYQWSRVFSVISLQDLSQRMECNTDELQQLLGGMAQSSQWKVEIKDNSMVHFPKLEPVVTGDRSEDLNKMIVMMRKLDASLSTSSKFLSLLRKDAAMVPEAIKTAVGARGAEEA